MRLGDAEFDAFLGSRAWLAELGADVAPLAAEAGAHEHEGRTVSWLARRDGERLALLGLIAFADSPRPGAREAIEGLHRLGIDTRMISGDSEGAAAVIARSLGLAHYEAGVLPQQKSARVAALKQGGKRVAMVGDGINDAPALAAADVGIAMGTGTDVAMNAAHVTLVKGDLTGIARARALSHQTVRNMWQNLGFAFVYNALGVPIAAGVLYPVFGLLLSPLIAAVAMSMSSVSVVGNALRLNWVSD